MSEDLSEFSYLWAHDNGGWVLLKSDEMLGGYCIFNKRNMVLKHIQSDVLNMELCQKMLSEGCEVLEDLPSAPIVIARPAS